MRIVGRNVVRIRLSSLLCITNCNKDFKLKTILCPAFLPVTYLYSNSNTRLNPDLCFPHIILSEIKGTLVFKHIWNKGREILEKKFKVNPPIRTGYYSDVQGWLDVQIAGLIVKRIPVKVEVAVKFF